MTTEKMKATELRAIRLKLNLSQQALGEALGFSDKGARQRIWEIEHGLRPIMPIRIKVLRILEAESASRPHRSVRLKGEIESQS